MIVCEGGGEGHGGGGGWSAGRAPRTWVPPPTRLDGCLIHFGAQQGWKKGEREGDWRGRRGQGERGGERPSAAARAGRQATPHPTCPPPPPSLTPLLLPLSPPTSCPFNEGASAATVLRQWIYHIEAVVQHADEGAAAGLAATGKVVLVFDMKTFPDTKEPPLAAQIECLRLAQVRHFCVERERERGMGKGGGPPFFLPAWLASLCVGPAAPATPPLVAPTSPPPPPLSPLLSLSLPPHTQSRPTTPSAWAWPSSATHPPSSGCSGAPCNPSWTR